MQELGNKMIGYVKEDKYVMIDSTRGKLGATKTIVLLDVGIAYQESEKSDTIYKSRILYSSFNFLNDAISK